MAAKKKPHKSSRPRRSVRHSDSKIISLLGVAVILSLVAMSQIHTTTYSANAQGVLGDEDNQEHQEEERKEEEKHQEEQRREEEKHSEEQRKEETRNEGSKVEIQSTSKTQEYKFKQEKNKSEFEYENAAGQKIKTKVEDDGREKVEIEENGIKIKYEMRNGAPVVVQEDEDGVETELEQELELEDDGLEITTDSGKLGLKKNRIKAQTNFPLSVNLETNELVVTTPNGTKVVTVLPDKAVSNLIDMKLISEVSSATQSADFENVELTEVDGELVYKVEGRKKHKIFGFIPAQTNVTGVVSAESGMVVETRESILSQFIDTISF